MNGRVLTLLCLLATGTFLALSTILAKLATGIGLSPLAMLAWSCLGAAGLLLVNAAARGHLPAFGKRTIEYSSVAALVSFAAPNLLFYSAIPHVGVSFVALAIAFPPLLTYLGALALRMERFSKTRAIGVALALCGAAYIAVLKLDVPGSAGGWVVAVLIGPVLLALGNLYRTLRWPEGAQADGLAATMLTSAAIILFGVGIVSDTSLTVTLTREVALVITAQVVVFAAQFLFFFILQRRGGPVYTSLLGAVAATIGVPLAILFLGEAVPEGLAVGGTLIALGIALVSRPVAKLRDEGREMSS